MNNSIGFSIFDWISLRAKVSSIQEEKLELEKKQAIEKMDRIDRLCDRIRSLEEENEKIFEPYHEFLMDNHTNPIEMDPKEYAKIVENMGRIDELRSELHHRDMDPMSKWAAKRVLQYAGPFGIKYIEAKGSKSGIIPQL